MNIYIGTDGCAYQYENGSPEHTRIADASRVIACVAACADIPDTMLAKLRVVDILNTSQELLGKTETLRASAAECSRMLETVTRELLAAIEMTRAANERAAAAEKALQEKPL